MKRNPDEQRRRRERESSQDPQSAYRALVDRVRAGESIPPTSSQRFDNDVLVETWIFPKIGRRQYGMNADRWSHISEEQWQWRRLADYALKRVAP